MLRNVKTPQILTNERACATSRLTRTPFGEDLRRALRVPPVAYGGASAVLGSPQVEHLAL
ncbi:MAG: hypothetical protein HC862_31495, partial [Scytonema sp. RU_4_4]|nr:hypothetical protein [Scytonema sp. RU_4_4]